MNNSSIFDSDIYGVLFTTNDMKRIWSEENIIQSWLDFEIALAKVEAELDIIPSAAAEQIRLAADIKNIDWQSFIIDIKDVGMAIKPLLNQITKSSNNELVKRYLHWGSTTQDVLDTAQALRIKESLILIRKQLTELINTLADMAVEHRQTIMVARTNSQDALPTTWGLQITGYITELCRHIDRIDSLMPRACTGLFGGAVGNMSSLNSAELGITLRNKLMDELKLEKSIGLANASQDAIAETVQFLALIHGSLVRIANDVELMSRTTIAELTINEHGGASSTMPNKSNPRAANMIKTLSRLAWMYAGAAPNLMDQQDVRSASLRMISWDIVPNAFLVTATALDKANSMMQHLIINKEKMRDNFSASKNYVMSEAVMMKLAEKIGRDAAYKTIKELIIKTDTNANSTNDDLQTTLLKNGIEKYLSKEELISACNPDNYLGCTLTLIEESVSYARNKVRDIN